MKSANAQGSFRNFSATAGFTLVEMLLSMSLVSMLAVTVGLFLNRSLDMYQLISLRQDAVYNANFAVERILEKTMKIAAPGTDITAATATTFTFKDAATGNPISFAISGTTITQDVNNTGPVILARQVVAAASSFTYFTSGGPLAVTGTQTPTLSTIAYVQITLTLSSSSNTTLNASIGNVILQKGTYLRNRNYVNFQ